MKQLGGYFALVLAWLLHFLPLPALAWLARGLGALLFRAGAARRRVALKNLSLCFPALPLEERHRIARAHFQAFAQVMLEQGVFWWASNRRFLRIARLTGLEHWQAAEHRPVIFLAPHFVGLDWAGVRLAEFKVLASVYSRQKNTLLDRMLLQGRSRFNRSLLFSRQAGLRGVVKALRRNIPFYYLPDLDFGRRNAVFVPFFGVSAATVTGLSRLARLADAVVLPVIARQLAYGGGYEVKIYPAFDNFPTEDITADSRRMNQFIEERIAEMPEQYLWTHKRFKTRPPGEPRVYD